MSRACRILELFGVAFVSSNTPPRPTFVSLFSGTSARCHAFRSFGVDGFQLFYDPSGFDSLDRSSHGRPPAVRLKRDSNTVCLAPKCPRAGHGKHQQEKRPGALGGGWWHGRGGRGRAGWRARWGCEGECAWRRGKRREGGERLVHPWVCSPRGRQGLCDLRACRAPSLTRACAFDPQGQRAFDDRPRAHGRAGAEARSSTGRGPAAQSRLRRGA